MDGTKLARIRACQACEQWRAAAPSVWRWPRCLDLDAELDNAFMEGPEANCPLGRWAGLKPIDLDAEAAAGRARREDAERAGIGPVLAALVDGLSEEEKVKRLGIAVQAQVVSPEVADEVLAGQISPRALEAARA